MRIGRLETPRNASKRLLPWQQPWARRLTPPCRASLGVWTARIAKLEAEVKENSISARESARKVEESVALQQKVLLAERSSDEKIERDRGKLQQALADERQRSQSFVEKTFGKWRG